MPVFSYTGLDSKGKEVKGIVDAEQIRAAKAKIKEQGIYLVDIVETQQRERKKGNLSFSLEAFKGGIKDADIVITTRLLSNLLKAHIPIVEALTAIIDQVEKPAFKMVLSQIRDRVNEGSSLSEALSQHPKLFSNIYANMVAAGEQSGALDIVMERLADFMEGQFRLKKKVQGAMVYPIIMFVFAIGVVGVLFTFVIPKIVKLFDDIKATLPLPTKILIWISSVVSNYWWLLLILLIIAVVLFRRWKRSEEGAYKWDRWMLNAPIFGDIVLMLAISRFSKTLSTLLSSGVPLLTSMDIVKNI